VELSCLGLRVVLDNGITGSLKILKLDQLVPIEDLQYIVHLHLTEMKIRLFETQKKSLMGAFGELS
jgi:hypothetical protein